MVKHKIKNKTRVVVVEIPSKVSSKTRKLVLDTVRNCVDEESTEKTTALFEDVLQSIETMLVHLKKDKYYSSTLEDAIRGFINIQLEEGMEMGKAFDRDLDYLVKLMKRKVVNYRTYIKKIRGKEKKRIAEYVLASFELATKAYLVGMLISVIVSTAISKKRKEEMEKEIWHYIQ